MKLWLDTEFNGWGGELISIAMVDEHGREFYEVLPCANPTKWVLDNVLPNLNKKPVDKQYLQFKLGEFLNHYHSVDIHASWPEDFIHLMSLCLAGPGYKIALPEMTMRLVKPTPEGKTIMAGITSHNALDDAKALKLAHP